MKMFFDTCLDDLVIFCLDKNFKLVASKKIDKLTKKVDIVPRLVTLLLKENNISINDIDSFYINIGPGSFTGSRIAITYCRTISQFLNTPIYTISSYALIHFQTKKDSINIKSSKYSAYNIKLKNGLLDSVELIKDQNFDSIDYEHLMNNFSSYLQLFKKVTNLEDLEPLYFHEPQIGEAK